MTTDSSPTSPESRSWLRTLGLHRRELRAWAMYDWANSAFACTIMAAVLPIYFSKVAASNVEEHLRSVYWGYTQSVALAIIALLAIVLGAVADYMGTKKPFLAGFAFLGMAGTAMLWFAGQGEWLYVAGCFIIGNIGFAAGNVFYESLLPHVAAPDEMDRVSTAGYAMGYVGGGLLLALNLAWIQMPDTFGFADTEQATRASFVSVAVWWGLFTIPIMRRVREPARELDPNESAKMSPVVAAFQRLGRAFRDIRKHRDLFVFLLAFWLYNDGIVTIVKMATIYGAEIGLGQGDLIGALLLTQFLGIPFTFAFGALASRIGAKRGIYLSLVVYTGISGLGYFLAEAWQFWLLACAVAMVQGGSQALSRSLYGSMVPPGKSSQYFSFYSISGKFGNIVGPLVFAAVGHATGSGRYGILSLLVFFIGGMLLLGRVDLDRGRAAAVAEEAVMHQA
ncbi:MFS transporter [Haliangium sp.]|uniref:MFS transporter n=1 Tax=Haliangium sp. TaxID=2663208 RepID=UPI003D116C41